MISFSFNLTLVNGCIMSFLISFSTHSIVTTSPLRKHFQKSATFEWKVEKNDNAYVGRRTAHGTELLKISCVTAHIYRFSFTINDFLSCGSLTSVNLTSMRSLAFSGCCETGHKMVESGFVNFECLAIGACDGTQKLGNSFSFPFAMFEIADVLVLGISTKMTRRIMILYNNKKEDS